MGQYISIDKLRVPKGNFASLCAWMADSKIFDYLCKAEGAIYVDAEDFCTNFRKAIELFANEEYEKKYNEPPSDEDSAAKIISDHLCIDRLEDFIVFLNRVNGSNLNKIYEGMSGNSRSGEFNIYWFIRCNYSICSESVHANVNLVRNLTPKDCIELMELFHLFLVCYYRKDPNGHRYKYDKNLIPVGDYVPLIKDENGDTITEIELDLNSEKKLYVREEAAVEYYLLVKSRIDQNRLIERENKTIFKLSEDNIDDPVNILRINQIIRSNHGKNFDFHVYKLPGKPLVLSEQLLMSLSTKDKLQITKGICMGVLTLHRYDPPIYHRSISAKAFRVFKINNGYKAYLTEFTLVKDNDQNVKTVLGYLQRRINPEDGFRAPEVRRCAYQEKQHWIEEWKYADIYSLAATVLYVLTGEVPPVFETEANAETNAENIAEKFDEMLFKWIYEHHSDIFAEEKTKKLQDALHDMMCFTPENRHGIEELLDTLPGL